MDSINKLINIFREFPSVGPRTAGRFVYYLLKSPKEKVDELQNAIAELKNKVKLCRACFNPFESEEELCQICRDASRNRNLLCIVEKEVDLISLENTKKYNGLYFVLGGTISAIKKGNGVNTRIEELKKTMKQKNFLEIIIALNPTPEGKATSTLIENIIKETIQQAKITHLALGIPVGGELEYADEETLESAILGRK